MKLFDSELKVMEVLWREGEVTARQIAGVLREEIGWNRNTTYTVIKKCIEKGAIKRLEPKFICRAIVSKEDIQAYETEELIDRMFDGSKQKFFAAFLTENSLTEEELGLAGRGNCAGCSFPVKVCERVPQDEGGSAGFQGNELGIEALVRYSLLCQIAAFRQDFHSADLWDIVTENYTSQKPEGECQTAKLYSYP